MLFLIKLSPEITIKSRVVRRRLTRQLRRNLHRVLIELDDQIQVQSQWDAIEVETEGSGGTKPMQIEERLRNIPGVAQINCVEKHPLPPIGDMLELTKAAHCEGLKGKTFAVRCKRSGDHSFSSVDIERFIGGGLNAECSTGGVKLKRPEVTVNLEIRGEFFYIVKTKNQGLGGLPLGCQDSVLSLISGGFDSSVSSYLCIKRGLQTHYCFFNFGGSTHEFAVKEVALFLWMKFHSSHRVKFITVPFEGVVEEILNKTDDSHMGVILKRMMYRAADLVAAKLGLDSFATGESVAQVSSQTLANLSVIDDVSQSLILRPLCASDKQEIINIAREIGTELFSQSIPEYCSVISKKPTTKARKDRIEKEESRFDQSILSRAVGAAKFQVITEVMNDLYPTESEVKIVESVQEGSIVIDIRHPSEQEINPLLLDEKIKSINIPFYSLSSQFNELAQGKDYLLYCEKGMMSRLHATHLMEQGFENVSVLELKTP